MMKSVQGLDFKKGERIMEQFSIWEGHMEGFRKKVKAIQNKCRKLGCEFHYAEVGEEIRSIPDPNYRHPITGKPMLRNFRFVIVEAEGTAIINNWEFVASVEHTEAGNIFSKALSDVEIPERYRNTKPVCEHCNSNRVRKNTFIVRNTETGEFKQVGNSCLKEFTFGMSAANAAYFASLKDIFEEAAAETIGSCYWSQKYFSTMEILQFTAETIRHFGFSRSENTGDSTKDKMLDFFHVWHGDTRYMEEKTISHIRNQIKEIGFDPDSAEAIQMAKEAVDWLDKQDAANDYMHNLKTIVALDYTTYNRFGILVSLFPTYNKDLELQAQRKAEIEAGKASKHVGEIGDRITVEVESIKCITSWESCYDGYNTVTTFIWKITGKDGNIYTWKTSKWLHEDEPPVSIKGTVKEHKVFREVKQTELTRCKITRKDELK